MFILTDLVPWIVKGDIRTVPTFWLSSETPQILITVHPRVAPARLTAAYVRTRHRFIAGRKSRRITAKHAALAVFVEQTRWPQASWIELRERWNEAHPEHPEWRYATEGDPAARRFALAARSAWMHTTGQHWSDRRRKSEWE
jgi:hypothetical protein